MQFLFCWNFMISVVLSRAASMYMCKTCLFGHSGICKGAVTGTVIAHLVYYLVHYNYLVLLYTILFMYTEYWICLVIIRFMQQHDQYVDYALQMLVTFVPVNVCTASWVWPFRIIWLPSSSQHQFIETFWSEERAYTIWGTGHYHGY